jgi:perosamine synthetase
MGLAKQSSGYRATLSDTAQASIQSNSGIKEPDGFIPLCVPEIRGTEWQYLKECLDTNWVSSAGPFVNRFEKMVTDYVGTKYGVATVNGTAALHIALLVAGVKPDEEVLVSTMSFIAPANAIRYVGAWPVFIDADPAYWQMDVAKLDNFISKGCHWHNGELTNRATGRRVKAILPVHILGHPCDMNTIREVARKYSLTIIEDATESLGAQYQGEMVGHLGDVACFSFNGNKTITTGGGGMVVTDRWEWAERASYLTTQAKDDPLEYIHGEIGYNYRLTNVQAALGCAQMEQLERYIEAKLRIAGAYSYALGEVSGIITMMEAPWASSVSWLNTVLIEEKVFGTDSRGLLKHLASSNIQARPLWQPLHMSPAHKGAYSIDCPEAERLYLEALSLPSSVGLTKQDQGRVTAAIADAGKRQN